MNEQIKVNEHIKKYIEYYIGIENPQDAVLLTGNWGCGKTYFIKELIKEWKELDSTKRGDHGKINCTKKLIKKRKKSDSTKDKIALKPIYVSLDGISDTHSIDEKIRAEISPCWNSKGVKVIKSIVSSVSVSFMGSVKFKPNLNNDKDKKTDGNISFNKGIWGKRILIFDDIEGCAIRMIFLKSYINNFVEHSRCKVILLIDEEKIKVKDIDYKDFKEKLIGQTFKVQSDVAAAVTHFINEINKNNQNIYLSKHKDLIKELFVSSKLENLKVFRQALLDFNQLTTCINKEITKHKNYDDFIKSLLAGFIMIYVEYKTGNENIECKTGNENNEEKDMFYLEDLIMGKIEGKNYKPISDKFELKYLTFNFYPTIILNYIKGTIPENELNDGIKSTDFFREYEEEQDWEKLWRWRTLEYKEFRELKDKVWKQFTKGEISKIPDLMHIAGIFMLLIHEKLLPHKKKEDIVSRSEQILEKIFENNSTYLKEYVKNYASHSSPNPVHLHKSFVLDEFKKIEKFLGEKVKDYQTKISVAFTKKLFEEITEDSINLLDTNLRETLPDGSRPYNRTAIFKEVDGKKLGERIKSFKNKSIEDFHAFIYRRYNVNLENYHKEDITCLVDLKKELKKNRDPDKKLKNNTLDALIKKLEKYVEKIKGI